ncbi:MAG: SGNH/GDSL hydrolase family protein [Oscillospiraceae bacterium]
MDIANKALLNTGSFGTAKRPQDSEKIRLAVLGGSASYGYMGEYGMCEDNYGKLTAKRLHELFPNAEFELRNYAISGTGCLTGSIIAAEKLPKYRPDIVFLEYAINERRSAAGASFFEGLIRKLLLSDPKPAVIPIALFTKDGYSCEDIMLEISKHYGLYFCGMKTALWDTLGNSEEEWLRYSPDGVHPNENGHMMISEAAALAAQKALTHGGAPKALPSPLFTDRFDGTRPLELLQFAGGTASLKHGNYYGFDEVLYAESGSVIEFTESFSAAALVYIQFQSGEYGCAEIYVDGVKRQTLQGCSLFGWGNPCASLIFEGEAAQHTVCIKIKGGSFLIGSICIS